MVNLLADSWRQLIACGRGGHPGLPVLTKHYDWGWEEDYQTEPCVYPTCTLQAPQYTLGLMRFISLWQGFEFLSYFFSPPATVTKISSECKQMWEETGNRVRLWWLRQKFLTKTEFKCKSLIPQNFKYDTKPTFRKRGHWFWAWGQEDQNHWGRFSALAVDTKYPRARGCCFSSSGASLERRRSPWLWKTKSQKHNQHLSL